ncbi:MAG: hypothetical protein ACRCV9_08930, partial [Burkholderiaceae bacterium]
YDLWVVPGQSQVFTWKPTGIALESRGAGQQLPGDTSVRKVAFGRLYSRLGVSDIETNSLISSFVPVANECMFEDFSLATASEGVGVCVRDRSGSGSDLDWLFTHAAQTSVQTPFVRGKQFALRDNRYNRTYVGTLAYSNTGVVAYQQGSPADGIGFVYLVRAPK